MIERCRFPAVFGMANHAVKWEVVLNVIGILNRVKIVLMTTRAVLWKSGSLVICMAVCTKDILMSSVDGKSTSLQVIKNCAFPLRLTMTGFTVCWKSELAVIWRNCRFEICLMAVNALLWSANKGFLMTINALCLSVGTF